MLNSINDFAITGVFLAATVFSVSSIAEPTAVTQQGDHIVRSHTVGYQDLNLVSSAGIEALYQRLSNASIRVCGQADTRSAHGMKDYRQCKRNALENAVHQVNDTRLTELHNRSTGNASSAILAVN